MDGLDDLLHLGASLGIGLLIGIERGWQARGAKPGTRVAGVRTFALIGLLGGISAWLSRPLGVAVLAVAFAAVAGLVVASYAAGLRSPRRRGATTQMAMLLTFVLGACPPLGYGVVAGAVAVVVAALLVAKRKIHRAVEGLEQGELLAALQLLGLAFVLMPVLPDEGRGPWGVWNLRELLWMVLLLGGLSFAGYFAVKRAGARLGFGLAAMLGGLVSSTAVTLEFSRRARGHPTLAPLLAAGVVAAGGTMFARVLVLVAVAAPALLPRAWLPLALAAALCWGIAWWGWSRAPRDGGGKAPKLGSPLNLKVAFVFATLLAVVALLAAALRAWLGDAGVYPLALVAGLGDVDAITLTLARQTTEGLALPVASHGVLIAAAANSLVKAGMALVVGGRAIGTLVSGAFVLATAAGAAALFLLPSVP